MADGEPQVNGDDYIDLSADECELVSGGSGVFVTSGGRSDPGSGS